MTLLRSDPSGQYHTERAKTMPFQYPGTPAVGAPPSAGDGPPREELFDIIGRRAAPKSERSSATHSKDSPVLALYDFRSKRLRGTHKGRKFRAFVSASGTIRVCGRTFNSPSLAAATCVGHAINGWWFWKYERAPGDWVRLRELRR